MPRNHAAISFRLPAALAVTAVLCFAGCERKPTPPREPAAATRPADRAPIASATIPHLLTVSTLPALATTSAPAVASAIRTLASMPFDPAAWRQVRDRLRLGATQFAESRPDDPYPLIAAADAALAKGDFALAVRSFQDAARREPANLDALQGLAVAYVAATRYADALATYDRIIALATGPAPAAVQTRRVAMFNQAVALSRLGELGLAQSAYERLLTDQPDNLPARFNLAALLQAQGQLARAAGAWRQLLADSADLPPADVAAAWDSLGLVLIDLAQPAAAADAFAQEVKLAPTDPAAWLNLAAASRRDGSLGRAIVATQRALDLQPSSDDILDRLGGLLMDAHRATGRRDHLANAINAWERSLQLNPNQPELTRRLNQARIALTQIPTTIAVSQPAE